MSTFINISTSISQMADGEKENSDNLTYFDGIVDIDRFRKFLKIFLDF